MDEVQLTGVKWDDFALRQEKLCRHGVRNIQDKPQDHQVGAFSFEIWH